MTAGKKKWVSPLIDSVGKGVDKLWRIEKKMRRVFQGEKPAEWPIGLNLGSLQEVSRRAEMAREIVRRAMKRRRRTLEENG